MKFIFFKLLIFLGFFLASDYLLGIVVKKHHRRSQNINLYNANFGFVNCDDKEVLFFGGSEISHSFVSPMVTDSTGLSSFNLAGDACGIYYQYPLLQTILSKYKPKAILISAMQLKTRTLTYLTRMYPYYDDNRNVKKIVDKFYPNEFIKLKLAGYVYNSQIIRIMDSSNSGNILNLQGYQPLNFPGGKKNNTPLPLGENYNISKENEIYFEKFIDLAVEKNVKIYVLIPPLREIPNPSYLNRVYSILKNKNVEIIDLSKDADFINNPAIFKDPIHLNHTGAKKITNYFIKRLKEDSIPSQSH